MLYSPCVLSVYTAGLNKCLLMIEHVSDNCLLRQVHLAAAGEPQHSVPDDLGVQNFLGISPCRGCNFQYIRP